MTFLRLLKTAPKNEKAIFALFHFLVTQANFFSEKDLALLSLANKQFLMLLLKVKLKPSQFSIPSSLTYKLPKHVAPYSSFAEFILEGIPIIDSTRDMCNFAEGWEIYKSTLASKSIKPAMIYKLGDLLSEINEECWDFDWWKTFQQDEKLKETERRYSPRSDHTWIQNIGWCLAQIHKGRSFVIMTTSSDRPHKRRKNPNDYSAFNKEIAFALNAGYKIDKVERVEFYCDLPFFHIHLVPDQKRNITQIRLTECDPTIERSERAIQETRSAIDSVTTTEVKSKPGPYKLLPRSLYDLIKRHNEEEKEKERKKAITKGIFLPDAMKFLEDSFYRQVLPNPFAMKLLEDKLITPVQIYGLSFGLCHHLFSPVGIKLIKERSIDLNDLSHNAYENFVQLQAIGAQLNKDQLNRIIRDYESYKNASPLRLLIGGELSDAIAKKLNELIDDKKYEEAFEEARKFCYEEPENAFARAIQNVFYEDYMAEEASSKDSNKLSHETKESKTSITTLDLILNSYDNAKRILEDKTQLSKLLSGTPDQNATLLEVIVRSHAKTAKLVWDNETLRHQLLHGSAEDIARRLAFVACHPIVAQEIFNNETWRAQLLYRSTDDTPISDRLSLIACSHPNSARFILEDPRLQSLFLFKDRDLKLSSLMFSFPSDYESNDNREVVKWFCWNLNGNSYQSFLQEAKDKADKATPSMDIEDEMKRDYASLVDLTKMIPLQTGHFLLVSKSRDVLLNIPMDLNKFYYDYKEYKETRSNRLIQFCEADSDTAKLVLLNDYLSKLWLYGEDLSRVRRGGQPTPEELVVAADRVTKMACQHPMLASLIFANPDLSNPLFYNFVNDIERTIHPFSKKVEERIVARPNDQICIERLMKIAKSHPASAAFILENSVWRARLLPADNLQNADHLVEMAQSHPDTARMILRDKALLSLLLSSNSVQNAHRLSLIAKSHPDVAQWIQKDSTLNTILSQQSLTVLSVFDSSASSLSAATPNSNRVNAASQNASSNYRS